MRAIRWWRRPYVAHAARVAAAATVIIMAVYVCVCAGFDVVDRQRLVAQIDTKLQLRLDVMVTNPSAAASLASSANAHDADDAPVFAWAVDQLGIFSDPHTGGTLAVSGCLVARAPARDGPPRRSRLPAGSTARRRDLDRGRTEPG